MVDMVQIPPITMTNELFFVSTVGTLIVDLLLFFVIIQRIKPHIFAKLSYAIFISSFVFWFIMWISLFSWGWTWFFSYIFPGWIKNWSVLLGLVYAIMGLVIWWLSKNSPGNPLKLFCLLGGLEGIISHTGAIFGLRVIETIPALVGVHPIPILLFAFVEKIFYWSLVLCFAVILQKIWLSLFHHTSSSGNYEKASQIRQINWDKLENQFGRNRFH